MNYWDTSITTNRTDPVVTWATSCNLTGCNHPVLIVRMLTRSYEGGCVAKDEEPPPRPRPWIVPRVPVVPSFRNPGLAPWRPRQQRARDGI